MDALQFAYWLQGFTELHGEPPTPEQWAVIKDHLALVFNKVTPPRQPQIVPLTPGLPRLDKWAMPLVPQCQTAMGMADEGTRAVC